MNSSVSPKVSIIVPVYNIAPYIPHCLDSLCGQTYQNIEIIVIDDGSTDNTESVLENYKTEDARITYYKQKNSGQGTARDHGLDLANGDWIFFMDGDDYLHEQCIELLLDTAIKNDCLLSRCWLKTVHSIGMETKKYESVTPVLLSWEDYFPYLFENSRNGAAPFGTCGLLYHHSIVEKLRFGKLRFAEDSFFAPKVGYSASKRRFAVIEEPLYIYYQRNGSTLHSEPSIKYLDRYFAKQPIMEMWKEQNNQELYDLFFDDYFSCMVNDYLNLCMYCPDQKKKYGFLYDVIKSNIEEAREKSLHVITLIPEGSKKWKEIQSYSGKIVLYGYGNHGRRLYKQLSHLGISVSAIWDKNADTIDKNGKTVVCPPTRASLGTKVLLAVSDPKEQFKIKRQLRATGVQDICSFGFVYGAVRYKLFERYLPFVLEDYV